MGNTTSSYRGTLKISASYEVYRASLTSSREKCSNLPNSDYASFYISNITEKGRAYCKNIEDIKHEMGNSYEF